MNRIISIIENNNYEIKEMGNNKYIFVNKKNNYDEIRIYLKDDVYNVSFPIKNSIYNYKTIFTSKNECKEYLRQILEYMFH